MEIPLENPFRFFDMKEVIIPLNYFYVFATLFFSSVRTDFIVPILKMRKLRLRGMQIINYKLSK